MRTTATPSSVPQRSYAQAQSAERHFALLVGVVSLLCQRPLPSSPITPKPPGGFYVGLALAACLCAPFWAAVAALLYFVAQ